MESLFPHISSATAFGATWLAVVVLIWALHRQWWQLRSVRRALWIVPAVVLTLLILWGVATRTGMTAITPIAATVVVLVVTISMGLVIVLPFSGITLTLERVVSALARRRGRRSALTVAASEMPPSDVSLARRSFITKAAAAAPALAITAASAGVAGSSSRTVFPEITMRYPGLPAELDGLRILHLSDIHLGYFIGLEDLEETLLAAESVRPDLVLVTGDVADDLKVLPEALRMIDGLKPRLGTFASIGNHEYYRGIEQVRRTFDAGPLPLMIEDSAVLSVGGSRLVLSAADDPARIGRFNDPVFLRRSVERAVDGAPSEAFHLLMSHRPEGFDIAAGDGVDLTLSGHYHGGIQVGWGGRAIIQPLRPDTHYWGHYRKGASQLYTSAGLGHWLPFRLNCPPEAPVIVLRKG